MPVNTDALMNVAVELSESENLKITIVESGKGACIAGGGAMVGGLLGGPVGLGIGGVIGSLLAAWNGTGKFKSVASVLMEMTPQQKDMLAVCLQRAFTDVQLDDAVNLMRLIMVNDALKVLVIQELCKFLKNEMGLNVLM